jgi:hypothetical protein
MFPGLVDRPGGPPAVVKTGTLTTTDGGVVVLAGEFDSLERGVVMFNVAATETGWEVTRWRHAEQRWLLELIESVGGAARKTCRPELPFSDSDVRINVPTEPSVDTQ